MGLRLLCGLPIGAGRPITSSQESLRALVVVNNDGENMPGGRMPWRQGDAGQQHGGQHRQQECKCQCRLKRAYNVHILFLSVQSACSKCRENAGKRRDFLLILCWTRVALRGGPRRKARGGTPQYSWMVCEDDAVSNCARADPRPKPAGEKARCPQAGSSSTSTNSAKG